MPVTADAKDLKVSNYTWMNQLFLEQGAAMWYAARAGACCLFSWILHQIDLLRMEPVALFRLMAQDGTDVALNVDDAPKEGVARLCMPRSTAARRDKIEGKDPRDQAHIERILLSKLCRVNCRSPS